MTSSDASADDFFATWGAQREMNELEATMWRGERHPANSFSGVMLELLEDTPAWARVVEAHEHFVQLVPRFRRRVLEPTVPLAPPVWVEDENFDLSYHLRPATLPAPGSHAQLMEFAQTCAATPLDRSRAPWTAYFVDGLEGGRSCYLTVVHHCLMDGAAMMQLLARLQPREQHAEPSRPPLPERRDAPAPLSGLTLATHQTLDRVVAAPRAAEQLAGSAVRALLAGPRHAADYAASLGRVMAPPPATPSRLMNSGNRAIWRFGLLECELAELKAAACATGGTVNDVYVAAILGGLRRYHEQVGEPLGDIPMSMPVSVRGPDDDSGGNRFAGAFLAAPTSVADPAQRIRALGETVRRIQREPALDFFSVVLPGLNRAPTVVMATAFAAMQAKADLTVSNVVGAPWALHFAGSRVERIGCYGALPGSAMTTVLASYDGGCTIGINCDGGAFLEADVLFELLEESLQEVVDLGRA